MNCIGFLASSANPQLPLIFVAGKPGEVMGFRLAPNSLLAPFSLLPTWTFQWQGWGAVI